MYGIENGSKVFTIPVDYTVTENLKVRHNSLEEAVKYVMENSELIPCHYDNCEYVDGTYHVSSDETQDSADYKRVAEKLKDWLVVDERDADKYDIPENIGGAA